MTHPETDYTELMGEADEVAVFFLLEDGECIVRVEYGQPDRGEAWVH